MVAQGGHGGAAADGTPGEPGQLWTARLQVGELFEVERLWVGEGGPGGDGAEKGDDAMVLLELYD